MIFKCQNIFSLKSDNHLHQSLLTILMANIYLDGKIIEVFLDLTQDFQEVMATQKTLTTGTKENLLIITDSLRILSFQNFLNLFNTFLKDKIQLLILFQTLLHFPITKWSSKTCKELVLYKETKLLLLSTKFSCESCKKCSRKQNC